MKDIRKKLTKRINLRLVSEILLIIENSDSRKEVLYRCIFDEDDVLVSNVLWVMTHFSTKDNEWLCKKQSELIDKVLFINNTTQERLLLTIINRQPFNESIRIDFFNYCLDEISNQKKSVGITALCMKLAYNMCKAIPDLLHEYRELLNLLDTSNLSPALLVSRKNILKKIGKPI